jgi:type IV secretory pathway VirB4 component
MNPLMCEPTSDNLEFLKTWLVAISGCDDPDSMDQISLALDVAFNTVPTEERSLATIYDLAFTPGSELHTQLRKWVDPSQYGRMFNAERDAINLDGSWLTTFDMTQLLDDPVLGGATVSYMMHRIRETMRRNNAPGLVMIDETEPLLRNPHFRTIFMVMQQELRKLSGVVLSVFQRPEALNAQGVSEVVRQQCGTFYLFQNPSATAHDYREFELTDRELGFVLGKTEPARRMERAVLIKRPMTRESVIVDVDLSPLGRHLKVFSSTNRDVELACQLQRQFGADWVSRYLHPEAP